MTRPILAWDFPLPRTHTGILLGNGVQGLMVWGVETLNVTVGRAGFWDHRGGNAFAARTTYGEMRRLLEAHDQEGLRRVFAAAPPRPGEPDRPMQYGCGRLELSIAGLHPLRGELDTGSATLRVILADGAGRNEVVTIRQAMDAEACSIVLPRGVAVDVRAVPAWDGIGAQMAAVGIAPVERFADADGGGWIQRLPADGPLALAWARRGDVITIATALGGDTSSDRDTVPGGDARARARRLARAATAIDASAWWRDFWDDAPTVRLPDAALQHAWDYGMYKFAAATTPGGVPASLQGPWLEEYQIPPWSCDYHFNINLEMIYGPAFAAGKCAHLQPLWDMIRGWLPRLRANAAAFFAAPDALMLPHAVDDRCAAVGQFWTGMIDHGCTAWMAQIAWLHYRHTMDQAVLREIAWPMLTGAFNGYWAMLEERDGRDGGGTRLSLPVSVSPEFKGDRMDAWGRDASFQLAACHLLAGILPRAAAALGEAIDPRWARVARDLPSYATITAPRDREHPERQVQRIALWEGMDLLESHRHHSHLAALFPFATIDPADPAHRRVVDESLRHWVRSGAGAWSGWCVPWAAALCARVGWADGAVAWLHWWKDHFTNIGHGTLHDADSPGGTTLVGTGDGGRHHGRGEIMQLDAGLGAVTAINELLMQQRGDVLHVLPAIPERWRELSFDGLCAEGAFRIGATVRAGQVVEVRVRSTVGGDLRLAHGLGPCWTIDGVAATGVIATLATMPDQRLVLARAADGLPTMSPD